MDTEEQVQQAAPEPQQAPEQTPESQPHITQVHKDSEERKVGWATFIEGMATDFFTENELEKMSMEDGNGNKAKISRTKDCGIKIEYTSTITL